MKAIHSVVVLLAAAAFSGCGGSPEVSALVPAAKEVSARIVEVSRQPFSARHEGVGTVRARLSSSLQSQATGQVQQVLVREGDAVKQGQLLLEMDSRSAAAQRARAESALREAKAMQGEVSSATLAASHARSAASAGDELAQTTYERFKRLSEQGAVSKQSFDEASARWRSATAQTAQAAATVASIQARSGEVAARIAQAEAELASAEAILSHTRVVAPFDGQITRKFIEVGDMAAPGAALFEMEAPGQFQLETEVDESLFAKVRAGDSVPVVVDALGSAPLGGTVAEIVPSADAQSRTFLVKIDLGDAAGLRSGMFGRAQFSRGSAEVLTVPESALVQRGQLDLVYALDAGGIARLRLVTLGRRQDGRVEVLSGLEAGERVVDAPGAEFEDGSRVIGVQGS